ncbi:DHA2 family efflux MFS transporter permease subunit [Rhodoferax sp. BAB1]|uniref:DHA2 family efflux MFS transporter permease subunit n=1 Tax=Rhodoferax sp. BAB1 TaxID=2741720 RepID=UPI001575AA3C|nr:DHA2 family efflux MFS transporter permease subunit [Rhodoferax sp. BAB1]QKO23973.1 DHA2 family efflux MFS transporter permease subunit [Rhodoferax sp. BAB1]
MQARYGERYRWLLLLAVMVGTMASIMSSTIINVAIPDMSHQFVLGQERAQWATSSFMVATTVAMLCTPWLLASFGYRRTYVVAMLMLLGGGVGGGLAGNFEVVLVARVVEGLAAGVVQPIPAIIIMRAFQPQERGRAGGIFGMGVVLAPALGPSIGGLLVDWFGWRSIFFMVVPFCVASIWLAYRYVPVTAPGGAAADRQGNRLDWAGLLLATVGTLCLLNGMVELHGATSAQAWALLGVALACTVGFIAWQRHQARRGDMPLMHPDLFAFRSFAMGSLVAFIYGTALFGSTYLLPLYIQMAQQLSASHVGTIMLPAGLVLAVTIPLAGRLSDHWPIRVLICLGLALLSASFALMVTISLHATLWLLVAWVVLGRIGLGFILPSLNNGAMAGLEPRLISQASSAINFLRMLGGAVGVSLCGIVLEWRIAAHGDNLSRPDSSVARLAAFDETFVLLAGVCALAMLAAWQMRVSARLEK